VIDEGVAVHRPARLWPVETSREPIEVAAPPSAPEEGMGRLTSMLPVVGALSMVAFAFLIRSLIYLVVIGFMVVAMVGATLGTTLSQRRGAKRRWQRTKTRYQEQVGLAVAQAEQANAVQRAALEGLFPDPGTLGTIFDPEGGLWERRPADRDFGHVRLGRGRVPTTRPVVTAAVAAAPSERPDPDLATMVDQARADTAVLAWAPVTIPLVRLGSVTVVGSPGKTRSLVGAWLASLAAFHTPGELRIAGWVPTDAEEVWDWLKWLPHCRDPQGGAGLGRADRAVTTDLERFAQTIEQLARTRTGATSGEHVVVVVDGWHPDAPVAAIDALGTVIERAATIGVSVIVLAGSPRNVPSVCGALVSVANDGTLQYVEAGPGGRVETGVVADRLDANWVAQFARRMAPLRLVSGGVSTEAADSSRLLELLGAADSDAIPTPLRTIDVFGGRRSELLAGPIGVTDNGDVLTIDVKEAAAGGMGPHGILVGATGSGKSELLRSLCASLAWRHHPSLLNLLLVDYKGGAAFAELDNFPHCAGLVTNLADQTGLIDRVAQALTGELTRRQELLRQGGNLNSIAEYQQVHTSRPDLPLMPYLMVVIDEFGELLAAAPEFLDTFIAIGRLGRSLGIHLLLATQRLDEGRIHGLEPHLRYRLCLRTNTAAESRSVLGSTAAYDLPSFPGLGLLQIDGELRPFKAAIASLPHRDTDHDATVDDRLCRVLSLSPPLARPSRARVTYGEVNRAGPTDLSILVSGCKAMTDQRATAVWLDPLPPAISLGGLAAIARSAETDPTLAAVNSAWRIPLGLVDLPATRTQTPLLWDLTAGGGNLGVAGSPRSGKTSLLTTAILSLAQRHRPDELQIYILDLAGAGFSELADLPHVGAVVGRQPEAAQGLVSELRAVVAERVASQGTGAGRDAARIVLVIDGAGTLRQAMPDIEAAVSDLAITGLAQGVHLAVATNRWFDLRPQLVDALGTRLELRLGDPADSMLSRSVALTVPADTPGRGLTRTGQLFQAALADLAEEVGTMTADAALAAGIAKARADAGQLRAPAVTSLPLHVTEPELTELAVRSGSPAPNPEAGFVLGMAETRARPAQLDLIAPGANLVIYGDPRSGRTTLLRRITAHLTDRANLDVYLIDPRRTSIDLASKVTGYAPSIPAAEKLALDVATLLASRLPPEDLTLDQLQAGNWWQGPDIAVVIDDYDLAAGGLTNPLAPLGDLLVQSADLGFHLIAARRVTGSSRTGFEPFSQRLKEITPSTLILSGPPEEGPLAAGISAKPRPPGRGILVAAGSPITVQCCEPHERQPPPAKP
jgi:S-DNA-T family DNA segregation ATPase FtsK/SpoIIIE